MDLLNHVWHKYIRGLHDRLFVQTERINDLYVKVNELNKRLDKLEKMKDNVMDKKE